MQDALQVRRSEQYARGLFEYSPVSLWVEDFSTIKMLLDGVRAQGIADFKTFSKYTRNSCLGVCKKSV